MPRRKRVVVQETIRKCEGIANAAHAERDYAEKKISEMQGALDEPRANIEALSQELRKTRIL